MKNKPSSAYHKIKVICFLAGGVLGLISILVLAGYFGIIHPLKSYISPAPYPIQHLPESREAEAEALGRLWAFFTSEKIRDSLVLNNDDINHLIRTNKTLRDYQVQYLVTLEDSLFNVKSSTPVHKVRTQLSGLIRRLGFNGWVNSELEGYVRLEESSMKLIFTRSQLNGRQVPFSLLGKRTHFDLAEFFGDRSRYEALRKKIGNIRVEHGKMIIIKR